MESRKASWNFRVIPNIAKVNPSHAHTSWPDFAKAIKNRAQQLRAGHFFAVTILQIIHQAPWATAWEEFFFLLDSFSEISQQRQAAWNTNQRIGRTDLKHHGQF